jgi:proline iminopeptidase
MTERTFLVNTAVADTDAGQISAAQISAAQISGHEGGEGPSLLLLHGGPGLSDYMNLLAGETAGWRTIRYQQRGLAPSAVDGGPCTVDRHVADALAVLDALDPGPVVVLGHSWGGFLALALAVAAPERVRALLLVDPLGAIDPDGGASLLGQALPTRLPAATLARLGEAAARVGDRVPTDDEFAEQFALIWAGYFADPADAPPAPDGLRVSVQTNQEGSVSVAETLAGGFAAKLAGVTVPTVFLLGDHSPMPLRVGQQTAAMVPGAEVIVVPGAGHLPWHERPGSVSDVLARFLPAR